MLYYYPDRRTADGSKQPFTFSIHNTKGRSAHVLMLPQPVHQGGAAHSTLIRTTGITINPPGYSQTVTKLKHSRGLLLVRVNVQIRNVSGRWS